MKAPAGIRFLIPAGAVLSGPGWRRFESRGGTCPVAGLTRWRDLPSDGTCWQGLDFVSVLPQPLRKKSFTCPAMIFISRCLASTVAHAICGVIKSLL